ncbi:hypothetical protein BDV93DRAFT_514129 [Ceratobasidium sp. AG-I]|nr:hypothetical protein BDV93DRAFT_514129 [Ceratobasidium sp. AG-I]
MSYTNGTVVLKFSSLSQWYDWSQRYRCNKTFQSIGREMVLSCSNQQSDKVAFTREENWVGGGLHLEWICSNSATGSRSEAEELIPALRSQWSPLSWSTCSHITTAQPTKHPKMILIAVEDDCEVERIQGGCGFFCQHGKVKVTLSGSDGEPV